MSNHKEVIVKASIISDSRDIIIYIVNLSIIKENTVRIILLFISLIFIQSCQSTKPPQITKKLILNNHSTIGLFFFNFPEEFNYRTEYLKEVIDPKLISQLKNKGFKVINRETILEVYSNIENKTENLYHTETGEINHEVLLKIKKETFKVIQEKYNVDYFLYQRIKVISSPFRGQYANWHGQEETVVKIKSGEKPTLNRKRTSFEVWADNMAAQQYGSIPALSYCTTLVNEYNEELKSSCGGIELIAKLVKKAVPTKERYYVEEVDSDEYDYGTDYETEFEYISINNNLQNKDKIQQAVAIAINKLLEVKK